MIADRLVAADDPYVREAWEAVRGVVLGTRPGQASRRRR